MNIEPTEAIVRTVATCIRGSDLWPYCGIAAALRRGSTLPQIVAYFLDVNHRVDTARALGQVFIDGELTEYRRVPQLVSVRSAGSQPADAVARGHECLAAAA